MKRLLPGAAALLLAGCGYIGEPLPPLANVPTHVTDLAAVQRGGRVIAQFTVPTVTTEGHPIPKPVRLDLRAGAADQFEEERWAADARQIPPGTMANGIARYEIPSADWAGKEIIFGVRVAGSNGKRSQWSNFVVVPVVAAPQKPTNVAAAGVADGVRLTWQGGSADYRVFRKTAEGGHAAVGEVQTPEWTDTSTEFGKEYTYAVQSLVKVGNGKIAESELSDDVSITPKDVFPPAAPKGLQASTAPSSIELRWERNTEGDMNGYRIYRGEGNAALEKVADISVVPTYSDRKVEHGKTYRYAISAVDQAGNESPRSSPIDVTLP